MYGITISKHPIYPVIKVFHRFRMKLTTNLGPNKGNALCLLVATMVAIVYLSEVWGAQAAPKLRTTLDSNLELRSKFTDHV